jgi:acyl-CoA synthetase (NDP forming)
MNDILASAKTLRPLLEPRAVAVLGASDDASKIGGMPLRYLRDFGYPGKVYAVNPTRDTVQGMRAYKSVTDIEGPVDMAIMAVPARMAVETAEAAAEKGVKALCTFTAGFSEAGEEGRRMQQRLADIARDSGMRILGPNCLGHFNTRNKLYATFTTSITHGEPKVGSVGLVSQSGAFGSHCFVLGRERGLGFSSCITTGNEVDITVAECLAYLAMDDNTDVLAVYMEGCKNGEQFMAALALAQERGKPVVIQKVGRSAVGSEAAASHTASLTGADKVYDAVFERYNAYRADTTSELIDIAYMLSGMRRFGKLPTGNKVAIATVSGGAGVMMADAAEEAGLDLAPLPEETQAYLKKLVPFAGTRNPVDFTAQVYNDFNVVTKNFDAIFREGGYDAVIGFFTALLYSPTMSQKVLDSLLPVRKAFPDRVFALSMIGPLERRRAFEDAGFLMLEDPSIAMNTIAATLKIGNGLARGPRKIPPVVDGPCLQRRSYNEIEAKALLAKAGVPASPERLARNADDAVKAASEIGYPVVLKIVSPDIVHKSDAGGVKLNLGDADAVREAYDTILSSCTAAHPKAKIDGVLVGKMISGGVEAILGVQRDPVFGPVVMFGLGGIFTEIMKDVTFRLAPFDEAEAMEMIRGIKGFPLLDGARGRRKCDQAALAKALAKLSVFAAANRDVLASIDINPVVVLPEGQGVAALDAVILTV